MAHLINKSQHVEYTLQFNLDYTTTVIFSYVLYTVVCQMINIFGIVTNIINIVCFTKQGFKDAINISLLGLSVSDLGSLLTMVWTCISFTPAFKTADLPFESAGVAYMVSAMPHFVFTRVSSGITAMITQERCLSIVAPLKVNHIFTPDRTTVSTVGMFIISTFSASPLYIVNSLSRKFSLIKNKTIVGVIFRENKEQIEKVTLAINNFIIFFIPLCTFVTVAISTAILFAQLRRNTEWRKRTMSGVQADRIASRNLKVSKMVVTISTLFILCSAPITVVMLAIALEPRLSLNGKYMNAALVLGGFMYVLENINSSVNIFIYHHMSTKYRDVFRTIFIGTKFSPK